jgi:Mor family transcriptional regulator
VTAKLPGILSEIAALAGEEIALSVARQYGGCRVSAHELAQHIEQLCSGEVLSIPKAENIRRAERDRQIRMAAEAGETRGTIARACGITERHVYRIIRRSRGF